MMLRLLGERSNPGSQVIANNIQRSLGYPPKMGAYTYLYAALSPDLGVANNGAYVIPWGRLGGYKKLDRAVKPEANDGTGDAEKFWTWSEKVTQTYM
jgi:retinol dehydrogenase-12